MRYHDENCRLRRPISCRVVDTVSYVYDKGPDATFHFLDWPIG
jgi:hypothetical protein